jgi:hypothetical protein
VAELRQIDPTATIWDFLKGWNGPRIDLRQGSLWVIEVKPWEELLMSRSKRLRNNVRRTLRRAEEDGVRCVLAGVEDVERASRRLVALHREMLRGRHIVSERLTSRFESFTLAAARRMTERGLGGISEFWRDGEVIISELMVFGPNYVGAYMVGNSREAFRLYEVSAVCAYMEVNIAHRWDASYVSLGWSQDLYKQRWGKEVSHYLIALGRSPLLWRFYLPIWRCDRAYRSLRKRVREYLRSGTTPKWVKDAAKVLRRRDA